MQLWNYGQKKRTVIIGLGVILILVFVIKSDAFQEKFFPERFYVNKIDELEKSLKEAEKVMYFHYQLFKNAERDAQKNYEENLQLFRETEPNANYDSLRAKAQKLTSDVVLGIYNMLQNAIDRRNNIHKELQEVKKRQAQFTNSTP